MQRQGRRRRRRGRAPTVLPEDDALGQREVLDSGPRPRARLAGARADGQSRRQHRGPPRCSGTRLAARADQTQRRPARVAPAAPSLRASGSAGGRGSRCGMPPGSAAGPRSAFSRPPLASSLRDRAQQARACTGAPAPVKTSSTVAGLDDLAGVHDRDPVGDLGDHAEVVGDQDQAHAGARAAGPAAGP